MLLSPQVVKSRGFLLMLVLFIFILVLAFFFGEGGLLEIIKARHRIDELKQNIADLENQKARLIKEIEELKKNPMALEKTAREKLWLMKKNEKVVVIVDDNKKENDTKDRDSVKSNKNKDSEKKDVKPPTGSSKDRKSN